LGHANLSALLIAIRFLGAFHRIYRDAPSVSLEQIQLASVIHQASVRVLSVPHPRHHRVIEPCSRGESECQFGAGHHLWGMKMRHFGKFAAAGLLAATLAATGHAAIVVNIEEAGGDILASYSGSLANWTGLLFVGGDINLDADRLSATTFRIGKPWDNLGFSGLSGPANWGPGGGFPASAISVVGDFFVLDTDGYGIPRIYIPKGYIWGRTLTGSATFPNVTFASLGLKAGQYVYTSPANQTITVNIGKDGHVGAVPEPVSWAVTTLGFGVIGGALRRRNRVSAHFHFT